MSIIYHDIWLFSQNATIGTRITSINATDKDTGTNAQIKFTIISGNDDGMFELNETSGDLLTLKELDYDQAPNSYKVRKYLKWQWFSRSSYDVQGAADNIHPFKRFCYLLIKSMP